jgi:hypothetical protein
MFSILTKSKYIRIKSVMLQVKYSFEMMYLLLYQKKNY